MKLLKEVFEIHNQLNPRLFGYENQLKDDVRLRLIEIADILVESIQEDNIPIKVYDYWLVGSNAAYNYSSESDIDVHIIVDMEQELNPYFLKLLYDYAKSSFNDKYNIKVKGHEVELYLEDVDTSAVTNGIYSLKQNKWIKIPVKTESIKTIEIENSQIYKDTYNAYINLKDEDVEQFIDDLYLMRKISLSDKGEFGEGNLVFKQFRNNGFLKDLKDRKYAYKSKQLTLEKLEEALLIEATTPQYREILFEFIYELTNNTDLKNLIKSGVKLNIHHIDNKYETYVTKNNTKLKRAINNKIDNIMIMSDKDHRAIPRYNGVAPNLISQYIDNLIKDKKAFCLKDCLPINIIKVIDKYVEDEVAISDASSDKENK